MKTVYIASVYGSIIPKQIVRETDSSIFVLGSRGKEERQAKETAGTSTFDKIEDAINFVIHNQKAELERAESRLNRAKENLSQSQAKTLEDWLKR